MKRQEGKEELRASINVIDSLIDNTLEYLEDSLYHSYRDLYNLEGYLPRELASFIEQLRSLPIIEEEEEL